MAGLSPEQIEELAKQLETVLGELWDLLPQDVKDKLINLYIDLRNAITALRNAPPGGITAALIALIERLQAFLARLIGVWDNFIARARLSHLVGQIERYLKGHLESLALEAEEGAGVIEGGAAAGETAGGVALGGCLLVLLEIIVLLAGLVWWYNWWKEKVAPVPFGGRPCGKSRQPVATGLTVVNRSYGGTRSMEHAMEKARKAAAAIPCSGGCPAGKCTGVPAITNWDQSTAILWMKTTLTFDVYCECI